MFARCLALSLLLASATPTVGFSEDDSRMNPVTKVVKLLEEMKVQVEKEAEEDKEMYEKMDCWCRTNEKEKTKAVEIAEQRIDQYTSDIEEGTAHIAKLETEIEKLNEDIAANEDALQKAEAMRNKEHDEFLVETGDMSDALKALKEAVDVLAKVQLMQKESPEKAAEAFLQVKDQIVNVRNRFKAVMQRDLWDLLGSVHDVDSADFPNPNRESLVSTDQLLDQAFMPKRDAAALAQQDPESPTRPGGGGVAGAKSYNSRSGAIFGILTQMKDEFSKNLIAAQKEEMEALIAYHEMKSAKEAELAAARKAVDAKTQDLADTNNKVAQAKQDLEDTQAAMAADQEFLVDLKEKCAISDKEYAARSKTRSEEIVAIGETIKILTDDDARDLFGKTMSLLQVRSTLNTATGEGRRRDVAAKKILGVAKKNRNWVLATLAVSVQLDAFTKVKKAMDDMVAELKLQQEEEVKKNDFCKAELDKNEDTTKEKKYLQEDLEAKIQDLEGTIETLTNDIQALEQTVAENHIQLKRAGEDRAAQNKEFQQVVADQRATVVILNKALARLQKFYAPKEGASLAQVKAHQEPGAAVAAPPPSGKPYQKSGGGGGVMQMIQMIIEDAKRAEEEAVVDEQAAQTAYASFVTETNAVLEQSQKDIVNKSGAKAQADGDLEEAKESLKTTLADLEDLHKYNGELHADCDFVLKNFKIRQEARLQEIEAIKEAKAILSGAV